VRRARRAPPRVPASRACPPFLLLPPPLHPPNLASSIPLLHRPRSFCRFLLCSLRRRYRPWSGLGDVTSSTFFKRAKVAFAGAMICAIADLGLLMLLGVSAEREDEEPRRSESPPPVPAPRRRRCSSLEWPMTWPRAL
jgi:hypothetical protein